MILALDIGNTNIKNGIFEEGVLRHSWRTKSDPQATADELGIAMMSFFSYVKVDVKSIQGVIVSSVIPSFNYTVEHMCKLYFDKVPIFVGPGVKTGLNIKYDSPGSLGSDRICSTVAANRLYGCPAIIIDFGTATTFNVLGENSEFLGGAICPGVKISALALVENTAKLPKVELVKPSHPIGKNTVACIQSGLLYGYIGQIEYILKKMIAQIALPDIKIIATGGMAQLIADECEYSLTINSTLTLEGLNYIFRLNS